MIYNRYFEKPEEADKYMDEVKKFVSDVHEDKYEKDDIKEKIESYYMRVTRIASGFRSEVFRLNKAIDNWENMNSKETMLEIVSSKFNTKAEVIIAKEEAEAKLKNWMELCEDLDRIRAENRNFNKTLCFSNIRELIKENPDVKIGQIESAAGIRLGYMSRLEKVDTAAEPSVEFIVTAAKLLNVSIDTLISVDLANLTPTEKYLVNFVEKLKIDTEADKLNWNMETKNEMERHDVDINGNSLHPLLSLETYYVPSGCEYPEPYTDNIYLSKTFDLETEIYGDCFDLRLKNGSKLFLMNVARRTFKVNQVQESVIEAVMYVPGGKTQVLATTKDEYPIGELLKNLYSVVKEHMKHPQVNKDAMYAINAFMNDDLSDDPEELPF